MSIWNMTLGEKIRYLREVEGSLRGLGRPMTQLEIVRAIGEEESRGKESGRRAKLRRKQPGKKRGGKGAGKPTTMSQSYLSQIESGSRPHLTNSTRLLLAKFFKVHPGYLVDDPEGFQTGLISDLGAFEDKLDLWLIDGAERFHRDADLSQALLQVAKHEDSRRCLVLLGAILENPGLADRLLQVLKPAMDSNGRRSK